MLRFTVVRLLACGIATIAGRVARLAVAVGDGIEDALAAELAAATLEANPGR